MPYTLAFPGSGGAQAVLGTLPIATGGFTVEFWFKTTSGSQQPLIAFVDPQGSGTLTLGLTGTTTNVSWSGSQPFEITNPSSANLTDGAWHHAAFVTEPGNFDLPTTWFYLDGKQTGSGFGFAQENLPSGGLQVVVGTAAGSSGAFNGEITDVRLWSTTRSTSQIHAFYRAGLSSQAAHLTGYWPLWNGTIVNQVDGASGSLSGDAATTFDQDPAWFPTQEILLNVPSQPFPQFSGPQGDAYSWIIGQLGYGDLRPHYEDDAFDSDGVKSTLDRLQPPGTIDSQAFLAVQSQLDSELIAVGTIQRYYTNELAYLNALANGNNANLTTVTNFVDAADTTAVGMDNTSLFMTIASDLIGLTPFGYVGTLMDILWAAISRTTSNSSDGVFQTTVGGLSEQTQTTFQNAVSGASNEQVAFLGNWGQMSAFLELNQRGLLTWPASQTNDLLVPTWTAYQAYFAQTLMKVTWNLYQIYDVTIVGKLKVTTLNGDDEIPVVPPAYAWSTYPGTATIMSRDDSLLTFPTQDLITYLSGPVGASQNDIFGSGWGLTTKTYILCNVPDGGPPCRPGVQ